MSKEDYVEVEVKGKPVPMLVFTSNLPKGIVQRDWVQLDELAWEMAKPDEAKS